MMFGFGHGFFGFPFGMIGGGICMALVVALIVVLIVVAVRSGRRHRGECCPPHGAPHNTQYTGSSEAERILKERFAKGEIDQATYESILKKIRE
jgi:putative membrane protein